LLAEGNIESLAKHLFSKGKCIIEGEIDLSENDKKVANASTIKLLQGLKKVKGVSEADLDGSHFHIESEIDITAVVSKYIVQSGFGLISLSKKVFGLDDIYHRYFQGTQS